MLGIQWEKHFPWPATPSIEVRPGSFPRFMDFLQTHQARLFADSVSAGGFLSEPFSSNKRRYYELAGDFLEFFADGRPVGYFIGNVQDWNTYYLRFCAILPEYRGSPAYARFLRHLLEILPVYGVERVEAHVSPANFVNLHMLTKLQFNVSGQCLSERWGALLHFTKFLSARHENVFLKQFCNSDWPQVRNRAGSDDLTPMSV
ncbi:MAG: GNAT family N-acetyltransferase [Bacteriovoracia bacterium]